MEGNDETSKLLQNTQAIVRQPSKLYKVLRIVVLFLLWVTFGSYSEIIGPVLPELIAQTNSQYDLIAQAVAMRGAGHALGGLIGGLSIDRWFHIVDINACVWLVVYTTVSVSSAYIQSISLLYIVFFVQGSVETYLQTVGYRIALKVWKEKAAAPLFALHMGYGIGSIITPQIVTPFLDPRFSGRSTVGYNSTCSLADNTNTTEFPIVNTTSHTNPHNDLSPPEYPAKFVIVYWMLSGLSLFISLLFLLYHIHGRLAYIRIDLLDEAVENKKKSFRESMSFKSCSHLHPKYAGAIVLILAIYYVISVPQIRVFSKFIYSYARDGPCLNVKLSTALESAYFTALTAGRLCAFLVSSLLHMKYLLQILVFGSLGSAVILFIWYDNMIILWIFVCCLGFFTGPIIPSAFAWANRYIEVTSTAQILPQIGAAIGDVGILSGLGYSYQNYGPYTLWYYQLTLAIAMVIVAFILQIFGSLHGDRHHFH